MRTPAAVGLLRAKAEAAKVPEVGSVTSPAKDLHAASPVFATTRIRYDSVSGGGISLVESAS